MQRRAIAGAGAQAQDAIGQPAHVLTQLFAFQAQLLFDVVDQRMRQDVNALEDHFVHGDVAIVAALTK